MSLGLAGNTGLVYRFVCPALGNAVQPDLWGTTFYTDDSPICWAAMHCERITRAMGGEVFVEVLPGTSSYLGAYRGGVVSTDYGPFTGSFTIIGAPTGPLVAYDGGSLWAGTPVSPQGAIDWEENPQANRGAWGVRFQYSCPAVASTLALGTIWGSSIYTDDSRICVAAAHVGAITRSGGLVTIETVPGISFYPSTNRNSILSNGFGAYTGSFLVVP